MNVLVIGAGPAGSVAATLLARAGVRVMLIEQTRFPRDKVCGECLSALGRQVLRRHGLDATLPAGRELTAAHLHGRSSHVRLDLPEPMLGLSRAALDATLLNAAAAAGADVRQPARVESVVPGDRSVVVRVRDLVSNVVTDQTVDYVLAADGRAVFADVRPAATADLGIKAHFTNVDCDLNAITLYGGFGCYGGVAPIENGRWNVAFSVPRTRVAAARGDLAAAWAAIVAESAVLPRHFARAERASDWMAAPLPRHGPADDWPTRVVPIGASACAIEPVGGEGMGTAIRSAELAVEALLSGTLATLPAAYRRLWSTRASFCRLGGRMMADDALSDAMAFAGHATAGRAAMWLVGK